MDEPKPSPEKPAIDFFKPAEPRLPGVPEKKPEKKPAEPAAVPSTQPGAQPAEGVQAAPPAWVRKLPTPLRTLPLPALYGGAGAVLFLFVLILWLAFGRSSTPPPAPAPDAPAAGATAAAPEGTPAADSSQPAEPPPQTVVLPSAVATVQEMSQPWAHKKFIIRQPGGRVPAMVLRIPVGSAASASGYWAFLLQSPYGRCELELVSDMEKLASEYGYTASNPMVVDPCTQTIFHPLRMGSIGSNTFTRGDVVRGTALRPPIAVDIRIEKNQIIAVRTE